MQVCFFCMFEPKKKTKEKKLKNLKAEKTKK